VKCGVLFEEWTEFLNNILEKLQLQRVNVVLILYSKSNKLMLY
jgi:hypothetical protein